VTVTLEKALFDTGVGWVFEELSFLFVYLDGGLTGYYFHPNPQGCDGKRAELVAMFGDRVTFKTVTYVQKVEAP
jgi:hypothetical protein